MNRRAMLRTAAGALAGGGVLTIGAGNVAADDGSIAAEIYSIEDGFTDPILIPDASDHFDTESFDIRAHGRVIHHELPFAEGKPYVLELQEEGYYVQRGATINFEVEDQDGSLWPNPGRWRAVVREQVYPAGPGAFGWSVTRVDVYARPRMTYAGSLVIVVWAGGEESRPAVADDVVEYYVGLDPANPGGQ